MKILLAVDTSATAEAMLKFLKCTQPADSLELVALHVCEPLLIGSYMSFLPSALLEEIKEKAQAEAEKILKALTDRLSAEFPHASVSFKIAEGFPREIIVGLATEGLVDLILVGAHSKKGVAGLLLGSVSQAVCANASCSVVVVR